MQEISALPVYARSLAPEHAGGQTVGAGARCALRVEQLQGPAEALRALSDPRARAGLQYPLWTVLTVVCVGLLMGIETKVHWRRDALGGEDRCRLRNAAAACVLALLRTALLGWAVRSGHQNLKAAQEEFASDVDQALRLILHQRLA